MARVSLENVRFRANHGLYEEERLIGNDFVLDIWIDADIKDAKVVTEDNMDKVDKTINYELVFEICRIEMEKPQKLLETVVEEIIYRLKLHFLNMEMVQLKLSKLNPPLGGRVALAAISEVKRFQKTCPKCEKDMICYKEDKLDDKTCWCYQGPKDKIHPRTQEIILQRYKNRCLCPKCLKEFEG